ncbi:scarecrow-like protein 33 [Cornus florida]|uniref:scarecrow-like protein 33 n=1 Tax=Cornus florida TaxID=4283 RepID=UPI0028A2055E|nr:scarecrow-like protein 33 [Cornus florida]
MVMDPRYNEFLDSMNGFKFDEDTVLPRFDQSQDLKNGHKFVDDSLDLDFSFMDKPFLEPDPDPGNLPSSSNVSSEVQSPDDQEFSETVLKFLSQILNEENMEEKPSMFHDPLALQAAEKSLYEVIGEQYPPPPDQPPLYFSQNIASPDGNFFGSSSENSTNSTTSAGNSIDTQWIVDRVEFTPSVIQSHSSEYSFQSTLQAGSQWSFGSINGFSNEVNGPIDPSSSTHLISNVFSDSESILQFQRGMEEASKFLPPENNLIIDLENYTLPPKSTEEAPEPVVKVETDEREYSPNGSRGRKHHLREDTDLEEERSSKQSAVFVEEAEVSELFDRVLLFTDEMCNTASCCTIDEEQQSGVSKTLQQSGVSKTLQQSGQPRGSNGGKSRAKNQSNIKEVVDLRTLLINCAQSVAADDRRTANEQLKQIRQHSSPTSDGTHRLAHIFANGLEARLAGTGSQIYKVLASKRISAAEKLKAYQLYLSACPFKKISIFFANKMIFKQAMKAPNRVLHIIDFGILYGFQWPIFIQHLASIPDGPPKLRITGIEFPQPGFRPAELVEETGRRLAKYCERFNVPFEYNAIAAQKWETIEIGDLKINSDEVLAVNCLFRFKNLLDETVVDNSPRDTVLKLIRKMNPDIFVHSVTNGSYSAPFFVTRFREALFHYSAWFDIFETYIAREEQERKNLEKEFFGREVMNVIACEGSERVERPETYKQWQVRNIRAGFRLLPLNEELTKKLKGKVKVGYHDRNFVIDEDSGWVLQGWKGRILYASSCWVPA